MDRFVCVRLVQANALDLSLFQFDFDLTFAVFFLNADRTLYGRFGTRSAQKDAARDISIEGFRLALTGALELHKGYPANKDFLIGKQARAPRFPTPENYPSLAGKYKPTLDYEGKVARSCMHCHQVGEAERAVFRAAHQPIPDEVLRPWPMPNALGLAFDPKAKARVAAVTPGSTAAKDGFKAGDEVLTLAGQPMLSIADAQWVLHTALAPTKLTAEIQRGRRKLKLPLTLPTKWRRAGDISWRPTSWDLRRMATGGLVLEEAGEAERRAAKIPTDELALRVKHVGQYGEHAAGKKAGFKPDDILVALDGQAKRMTESELFTQLLQTKLPGDRVSATVLRSGERVNLELPQQ